jgi:hypothetical protein
MSTGLFRLGEAWMVQLEAEHVDALLGGMHVHLRAQPDEIDDYEPSVLMTMGEQMAVHRTPMFTRITIPEADLQGLSEGGMCQMGAWSICSFGLA